MRLAFLTLLLLLSGCLQGGAAPKTELEIQPIVHASVMLNYGGKIIYVDPTTYFGTADYSDKFKADIILITHDHFDHYDFKTLNALMKENTRIIAPGSLSKSITYAQILRNTQSVNIGDVMIEAMPAYNLVRGPGEGKKYHSPGAGNGYVLTLGSQRVYIAGDTECTPEVKALKNIDVAFLPIDGVYTMSPEEAAACAEAIKPKVVYPYHQGGADPNYFASLLKDKGIDVRVHKLP